MKPTPATLAEIPAETGHPYVLKRAGKLIHLTRNVTNTDGKTYTALIVLSRADVLNVSNALIDAIEEDRTNTHDRTAPADARAHHYR